MALTQDIPSPGAVPSPAPQPARPARRRVLRGSLRVLTALLTLGVVAVIVVAITFSNGRTITMPGWVNAYVVGTMSDGLEGRDLTIDQMQLTLAADGTPQMELRDVLLDRPDGRPLLALPDLRVALDRSALLTGRVLPKSVIVRGAALDLDRAEDGGIDVAFGTGAAEARVYSSYAELMEGLIAFFDQPALSLVTWVEMRDVVVRLRDRQGRGLTVDQGSLVFTQTESSLIAQLDVPLLEGDGQAGTLRVLLDTDRTTRDAAIRVSAQGLVTDVLAQQHPALAALSQVHTALDGGFEAELSADGTLRALEGAVTAGAGLIYAGPTQAVPFDRARVHFEYDAPRHRLHVDEITFVAPEASINGSGHVLLPDTLSAPSVIQLSFDEMRLAPQGVLPQPAVFDRVVVDAQLDPATGRVNIGQLVAETKGAHLQGTGWIGLAEGRPLGALDMTVDQIAAVDLLSLWPTEALPGTRRFLSRAVEGGTLSKAQVALRLVPEGRPKAALTFNFQDATVRPLRFMPPISGGHGRASIAADQFSLSVHKGAIETGAGALQVGGSAFRVPDIRKRPGDAQINLQVDGPVPAALALLDFKPLEVFKKAGRTPDFATGQAQLDVTLGFPMRKKVLPEEVTYRVTGQLRDVASDVLVPNRQLRAPVLEVLAQNRGVEISGAASLDSVPLRLIWSQTRDQAKAGQSRVTGTVTLSEAGLETFGVRLAPGTVTGQGPAPFDLDLARGSAPVLQLSSTLEGVGLSIPALGWSKPAGTAVEAAVRVLLGPQPEVPELSVVAPGLVAQGSVSLAEGGAFEALELSTLTVGEWLDASAVVTGRGPDTPPAITLTGGALDIRSLPPSQGGDHGPFDVTLDQVILTPTFSLTDVRAQFAAGRGLSGQFSGAVNGIGRLVGTAQSTDRGPAIVIRGEEQGGEMVEAAGIFKNARGGSLDLSLRATGAPRSFEGSFELRNTRLVDAPEMAELLQALSVVGLLEQLAGEGLSFGSVEGDFVLKPEGVNLRNGSAVGPSLGISFEGAYAFATRALDIQGVVSPVYFLNAVGQVVSRKREGLFGLNYRISGTPDNLRTSVNPLSALTPGIFREIFKRPAPKVQE